MGYDNPDIKSQGKFLKIESGDPHDIRLLNPEPFEIIEHFSPAGSFECKGDICGACKDGDEPNQRWVTNVFDHNTKKVKIFKYGAMVAKALKSIAITLSEEGKSIMDVDLKVEATGSNMQKKYTVTPRMTSKTVPSGLELFPIDIPF